MLFPQYLLLAAIGGMGLGAIHGAMHGYHDLRRAVPVAAMREPIHIITYVGQPAVKDALMWALMGPWAPVALPIWLFYWKDVDCSMHIRKIREE